MTKTDRIEHKTGFKHGGEAKTYAQRDYSLKVHTGPAIYCNDLNFWVNKHFRVELKATGQPYQVVIKKEGGKQIFGIATEFGNCGALPSSRTDSRNRPIGIIDHDQRDAKNYHEFIPFPVKSFANMRVESYDKIRQWIISHYNIID